MLLAVGLTHCRLLVSVLGVVHACSACCYSLSCCLVLRAGLSASYLLAVVRSFLGLPPCRLALLCRRSFTLGFSHPSSSLSWRSCLLPFLAGWGLPCLPAGVAPASPTCWAFLMRFRARFFLHCCFLFPIGFGFLPAPFFVGVFFFWACRLGSLLSPSGPFPPSPFAHLSSRRSLCPVGLPVTGPLFVAMGLSLALCILCFAPAAFPASSSCGSAALSLSSGYSVNRFCSRASGRSLWSSPRCWLNSHRWALAFCFSPCLLFRGCCLLSSSSPAARRPLTLPPSFGLPSFSSSVLFQLCPVGSPQAGAPSARLHRPLSPFSPKLLFGSCPCLPLFCSPFCRVGNTIFSFSRLVFGFHGVRCLIQGRASLCSPWAAFIPLLWVWGLLLL